MDLWRRLWTHLCVPGRWLSVKGCAVTHLWKVPSQLCSKRAPVTIESSFTTVYFVVRFIMPTDYLYWQRGKISNCQRKAGFTICCIAPSHRIALPRGEESISIFRAPHDSALCSGAHKFTQLLHTVIAQPINLAVPHMCSSPRVCTLVLFILF